MLELGKYWISQVTSEEKNQYEKKKSGEEEKTNLWLKNKQKAMSILDHQRSQI